ncbi:adipolin [Trichonephila clavipes]|nr:adipolin [Trichonephila clavipes]
MPSEIEKDKKDFARLTWNLFQAGAQLNERKTRKRLRAERRKNLKAGGPRTLTPIIQSKPLMRSHAPAIPLVPVTDFHAHHHQPRSKTKPILKQDRGLRD